MKSNTACGNDTLGARLLLKLSLLFCAALVADATLTTASATGIPLDGFLPQIGITLTTEHSDDLEFSPFPSSQPGGIFLGDSQGYYDVALLDTGAAVSLITTATDTAFNIDGPYSGDGRGEGFRGTEVITIGGASGFLDASIGDALGLYAGGLQDRTASGATLKMNNSALLGQTNTSIITVPPESDLPNVLGLPFAGQYATRIRNSVPQILEVNGKTVRSPAVDFQPLGSEGMGITRKAQLHLLGDSPSTPLMFPNLGNFDLDFPSENPSQPTFIQGGHFLDATFNNDGASLTSQFFLDTGASVTVLSQFKALEMGFDVTLDEPEFTISIVGSGGTLGDVPGFFIDQLTVPALGGSFTVANVPVIVLDVTNVSNPGNIVDGIIGMNVFQGRDLVIDPNPSLGGGGPSPGLYISDPVTTDFNWASAAATDSWASAGSWSTASVPDLLSIANVRHVTGGDQQATVEVDAEAFEVNISGGSSGEQMKLSIANGVSLTTFSGVNVETDGALQLDDATVDAQFVDIREGGLLAGSGTIRTGSGTIPGQVEVVRGTVSPGIYSPGSEVGSLEIDGRFATSDGSTLQFDLGGLSAGDEYDQIVVEGSVSLGGTLELSLVDLGGGTFAPTAGDTFTLLTSTEGMAGQFDSIVFPSEYNFDVQYLANSLRIVAGLQGDFNGDGTVNLADYVEWRNNLGGLYNASHYTLWKDNFGMSLGASHSSAAAAVPEPSSVLVLLLGLATAGRFRGFFTRRSVRFS
ncbi:aspartyl protease family protein [Aeoliella sp.]|uniref:aspartyl protease family protein n=1 Tax=Aeoliella sp. TaxID=2795800 RepID=UPI003CCBBBB1